MFVYSGLSFFFISTYTIWRLREALHLYKSHIPTEEPSKEFTEVWCFLSELSSEFGGKRELCPTPSGRVWCVDTEIRVAAGAWRSPGSWLWGLWLVNTQYWDAHWEIEWSLDLTVSQWGWQREKERECVCLYRSVCDRKGALCALKSGGHCAPCCSERESEAHGAQESAGLVSGPTFQYFSLSISLWMNPERANTVLIRGKKSDGLEALAQTAAFLKVVTFVGLYWRSSFYFLPWLNLSFLAQNSNCINKKERSTVCC